MERKTRVEAVADTVTKFIMEGTGITIRPPPLKNDGDCTVRVSGDRGITESLNGIHAEREMQLTVYCKSSDSRAGAHQLSKIQDYISSANIKSLPAADGGGSDAAYINAIAAGDTSEDNKSGEWIYQMNLKIRYCY